MVNSMMKTAIRIILISLIMMMGTAFVNASMIEGTSVYKDYVFILVHGLNGERGIFEGQKQFGNLRSYLENDLGLTGRVYYYNFSNNRGDNFALAKELGDRTYHNPIPEMNGNSWLTQARIDFKKEYARTHAPWGDAGRWEQVLDSVVPTRYIIITHSMGSFAARAYIYSDQLYEKSFYNNDVAAIITIDSQHLGSDGAQALKNLTHRCEATVPPLHFMERAG